MTAPVSMDAGPSLEVVGIKMSEIMPVTASWWVSLDLESR